MLLHGLNIIVEHQKGSRRSGTAKDGTRWEGPPLPCAYGAIKNTRARDGEQVDAYIGPYRDSKRVFVVDQVNADTRRYDEDKVLLGFRSKDDALAHYRSAFSDGKAGARIGAVTEMSAEKFCDWLLEPENTKKPLGDLKGYADAGKVRDAA